MYLVIFDCETSGTDESTHDVIQLAAIAFEINGKDWRPLSEFERKLEFDLSKADPEALEKNSYDEKTWATEAVNPYVAVNDFKCWLNDYRDVERVAKKSGHPFKCVRTGGHNINSFDHSFVRALFKKYDVFCPLDFLESFDSLELGKWLFRFWYLDYKLENFQLGTLCREYGIDDEGSHDALNDVRMNAKLVWAMRYCKPKGA